MKRQNCDGTSFDVDIPRDERIDRREGSKKESTKEKNTSERPDNITKEVKTECGECKKTQDEWNHECMIECNFCDEVYHSACVLSFACNKCKESKDDTITKLKTKLKQKKRAIKGRKRTAGKRDREHKKEATGI